MTMIAALLFLLAQQIVPPQPVETPPAVAPEGTAQAATVVLLVTIGADGAVENVGVAESAGPALDAAAIAAVVRWKFKAALRDGVPFEARVRIPFRFAPAPPPAPAGAASAPLPAGRPPQPAPEQTTPQPPPGQAAPPQTAPTQAGTEPAPSQTEPPQAGTQPAPQTAPTQVGTQPAPSQPASPQAATPVAPPPEAAATQTAPQATAPGERVEEVTVRGHQRKVERGGSDFVIDIGQLAVVPRKNAENLLELAPGIFLANEGGEGHAEQVFLRGFNAEQGQAIEFSVNGVPINEVDNPDSHGYADTHFIIPELIKDLQVTEGPFDPHQGDFAVAGSARYELGVRDRGLRFAATRGSYGTQRYLALWAPKGEREGTFAAAQFSQSDGFGANRASGSASAMAQYEGDLGQRGLFRLLATTYSTHYRSAGVVRKDDVDLGRIDFFGSEDPSQGGDATRHSLSFDVEAPLGDAVAAEQLFLTLRSLRIVENFTGLLLDTQEGGQSLHDQRGDAVEQTYTAVTVGSRGSYRLRARLLDHEQAIEGGYYARYDHTTPLVQRLRFGTQTPYLTDLDLSTDVVNLAGYLDADLRLSSFLTLRGGLRQEFFEYNVEDFCNTTGNFIVGAPLDVNCPSFDRAGPRLPTRRVTATGQILAPKGTAIVALPLGLSLTGSYGIGASSLDPTSIEQDENAPFVKLRAYEGGLLAKGRVAGFDWTGRAVGYQTKADRDFLFNPALGRLAPASATTRTGVVVAARATSRWLDESASFTTVHPIFDDDGTLVPYTPLVVGRSDTALYGPLPASVQGHALQGTLGLGLGYVGKRSLPFSQFSDPTLQIDASATVRWTWLKLGLSVTNLTNQQFPLSQFFYASDFHSRSFPTLAPAGHFTAAPPRIVLFTMEVALDREGE
jgi:TonB family protein